jgi:hypothetical protein
MEIKQVNFAEKNFVKEVTKKTQIVLHHTVSGEGVDDENTATTYYISFTEILGILKTHTNNNQLKSYNLQTAMRKAGFENKPVKKSRFENFPRYLYPVQLISKKEHIEQKCSEYK